MHLSDTDLVQDVAGRDLRDVAGRHVHLEGVADDDAEAAGAPTSDGLPEAWIQGGAADDPFKGGQRGSLARHVHHTAVHCDNASREQVVCR